tara:strand:+ start:781 stop:1512 length:732 start_codon:yes stop_codon:yes gene_type:complete
MKKSQLRNIIKSVIKEQETRGISDPIDTNFIPHQIKTFEPVEPVEPVGQDDAPESQPPSSPPPCDDTPQGPCAQKWFNSTLANNFLSTSNPNWPYTDYIALNNWQFNGWHALYIQHYINNPLLPQNQPTFPGACWGPGNTPLPGSPSWCWNWPNGAPFPSSPYNTTSYGQFPQMCCAPPCNNPGGVGAGYIDDWNSLSTGCNGFAAHLLVPTSDRAKMKRKLAKMFWAQCMLGWGNATPSGGC